MKIQRRIKKIHSPVFGCRPFWVSSAHRASTSSFVSVLRLIFIPQSSAVSKRSKLMYAPIYDAFLSGSVAWFIDLTDSGAFLTILKNTVWQVREDISK